MTCSRVVSAVVQRKRKTRSLPFTRATAFDVSQLVIRRLLRWISCAGEPDRRLSWPEATCNRSGIWARFALEKVARNSGSATHFFLCAPWTWCISGRQKVGPVRVVVVHASRARFGFGSRRCRRGCFRRVVLNLLLEYILPARCGRTGLQR